MGERPLASRTDHKVRGTLPRLLWLAAPFWRGILLAAVLGFATIGSSVGLMTTSAFVIAKAALQPSIAELQVAIVGIRFFGIARGIFRYLERYLSHEINFRLLARLRVWFYRALEPLAPARLLQYRSGDLLSRIVADIETLQNLYVRVLAPPLVALLIGGLMWVFMSSFSARLAAALLLALALAGVVLPLLTRTLGKSAGQKLVQVRSEMNAALVDGVQGAAELLAFGREQEHLSRIKSYNDRLIELQARMARITGLHSAVSGLLMHLAVIAILMIAIPMVRTAEIKGVTLAVLVLAVISSFEAVIPLPLAFQYLDNSLAAGRRLFEIVEAEPAVRDRKDATASRDRIATLQIRNLTFRYSPAEPPALQNVSFTLSPGGRVAIVGPSGAGKSTLINLLLRFWEFDEGQITIDGRDIREMPQEAVRELFGVVSQRTHLFNDTLRNNLLLARPEASQHDLIRAAQQAQLHEFIQSLPDGYDTWIGEQGVRLSGGERQRLAIARTILQDAPILILDEATANLDAITEQKLRTELQTLMENRSTLIITHRLAGLESVDEILVLRDGRAAERGQHYELMQMEELYHRLWTLQNQVIDPVLQ